MPPAVQITDAVSSTPRSLRCGRTETRFTSRSRLDQSAERRQCGRMNALLFNSLLVSDHLKTSEPSAATWTSTCSQRSWWQQRQVLWYLTVNGFALVREDSLGMRSSRQKKGDLVVVINLTATDLCFGERLEAIFYTQPFEFAHDNSETPFRSDRLPFHLSFTQLREGSLKTLGISKSVQIVKL